MEWRALAFRKLWWARPGVRVGDAAVEQHRDCMCQRQASDCCRIQPPGCGIHCWTRARLPLRCFSVSSVQGSERYESVLSNTLHLGASPALAAIGRHTTPWRSRIAALLVSLRLAIRIGWEGVIVRGKGCTRHPNPTKIIKSRQHGLAGASAGSRLPPMRKRFASGVRIYV